MSTHDSFARLLVAPSSLKGDYDDAIAVEGDEAVEYSSASEDANTNTNTHHARQASTTSFSATHPQLAMIPRVNSDIPSEAGSSKSSTYHTAHTTAKVDVITVSPQLSCTDDDFLQICRGGVGTVVAVRMEKGGHYNVSLTARGLTSFTSASSLASHSLHRQKRSFSSASSQGVSQRPIIGVVSDIPEEVSMSSKFKVRLYGVGLVRVSQEGEGGALEAGAHLVPSQHVGVAVKAAGSSTHAFATVVETPQKASTALVLARLTGKLPLTPQHSHTTPETSVHEESIPVLGGNSPAYGSMNAREGDEEAAPQSVASTRQDNDSQRTERIENGKKRQSMWFFLLLTGVFLAGSILVVVKVLPKHNHPDVFHFSCNETAAMGCTNSYGESFDECHALFKGLDNTNNALATRCCKSAVAYACYTAAFCFINCPEVLETTLAFNLENPADYTQDSVQRDLFTVLNITQPPPPTPPPLYVVQYNNQTPYTDNPTVLIAVSTPPPPSDVSVKIDLVNRFWTQMNVDTIREDVFNGVYDMPWVVEGSPDDSDLLNTNGWLLDSGNHDVSSCTVHSGRNQFQSVCHHLSGSRAHMVQTVNISHYPAEVRFVYSGFLSATGGEEFKLDVHVEFHTGNGTLITEEPTFYSPFFANAFYPQFVPFLWHGVPPAGTAMIKVNIACANERSLGGRQDCDAYFGALRLQPQIDTCGGVDNCLVLRCLSPFNVTHSLCLSADVMREPSPTPYTQGHDITGIDKYFMGGSFDEYLDTVGASFRGLMLPGHEFTSGVVVKDKSGLPVPGACGDSDVCGLYPNLPAGFRYDITLAADMNNIPPEVHDWTITGVNASNFAVHLSWYIAKKVQHEMDIT